jgi:serine/threonine protein kinase
MGESMTRSCAACGGATAEEARFCPTCGAEQRTAPAGDDPLVGRIIGERYQICELIGVGGMGRVYRAVHGALERTVAIKFVNREILANEGVVARFMTEARTASRLNHPHVVVIHDFGRTPVAEGGDLYFVMEFLSGPSLRSVLKAGPIPLERSVRVLCQMLSALGQAHQKGITHRDVKPGNVHVEQNSAGGDHVKMIDFGIAKLVGRPEGSVGHVTQKGQILGTPNYLAPEQARGDPVGPAADLYAVGVILFQLLTGKRPFVGKTAEAVIAQHLFSPRPSPLVVAAQKSFPPALANVCVRAMDIDPTSRYPTAEALARAIVEGAGLAWSSEHTLLFPGRSEPPPTPSHARGRFATLRFGDDPRETDAAVTRAKEYGRIAEQSQHSAEARSITGTPLVGRTEERTWAIDRLLRWRDGERIVISGAAGTGRTRLLEDFVAMAARAGGRVIHAPSRPPPHREVSGDGLRTMIPAILGSDAVIPLLQSLDRPAWAPEAADLFELFSDKLAEIDASPAAQHRAPAAVLTWALRRAVVLAGGAPLILAIDDVDHLDTASRAALVEVLSGDPIRGLAIVMSEKPGGKWPAGRVGTMTLQGLSQEEATAWYGAGGGYGALGRPEGNVEPLYVELLLRWYQDEALARPLPPRLADLVEWRLRMLSAVELRVVQALAVVGSWSVDALGAIVAVREDIRQVLPGLERAGLIATRGDSVALQHLIFGHVALALAPRSAVADLHLRAAEALAGTRGRVELRAYHAIRGRPDIEAFLLVEESARRRMGNGDLEGAILALSDGLRAARDEVLGGETEMTTTWVAFGQKLSGALVGAGLANEASGVLREILDMIGPASAERALVLEQVAKIADHRGRPVEAEAARLEALGVAEAASRPNGPSSRNAGLRKTSLAR